MKVLTCPKCGGNVYVLETRYLKTTTAVRRRRGCEKCGYKYNTYELDDETYKKLEGVSKKMDKIRTTLSSVLREVDYEG